MKYSSQLPILYSFRRCPYAMRARMAIQASGIKVELREVLLRNKPEQMLQKSAKGTVPVLVLGDGQVIDESLDIMLWTLNQNDPENWLESMQRFDEINPHDLINENDMSFKNNLDKYKYFLRHPDKTQQDYRKQAEVFLDKLEQRLLQHAFLNGQEISLSDIAIFPFIRQFAAVDKKWFQQSKYSSLKNWLKYFLDFKHFKKIMDKYQPWEQDAAGIIFPTS